MEEKRAQPRFNVCLTVQLAGCAANNRSRISDLSEGGCYVDSIAEVMVGEVLLLRIRKDDGESFELEGMVTHHFPRLGFGVRFVNLNEEQCRQITSLLPKAKPDAGAVAHVVRQQ